jgi:hypothetical protein
LCIDHSRADSALLGRSAVIEGVHSLAERSAFYAGADVRSTSEFALQGSGVAIRDIGVERDKLARSGDMRKGGSPASGDDLVCACARSREVVHATEGVFEVDGMARLDDREGLGPDRGGGRPLDLLSYLATTWIRAKYLVH